MAEKELKFTTFLLRDVESELWTAFREKAAANRTSARAALLELIREYVQPDRLDAQRRGRKK